MFTVRELLTYTGQLQCPSSPAVLRKRVNQLLSILGLSMQVYLSSYLVNSLIYLFAHIHDLALTVQADERCGSLTGGQRKRVSIGLGLVGQPSVLFLDEPTTGLDSTSALNIVKYISAAAKATNVVVIMTIHQPAASVFNSLDDLCLLELGRLVYFGRLETGSAFFSWLGMYCTSGCNPAGMQYCNHILTIIFGFVVLFHFGSSV